MDVAFSLEALGPYGWLIIPFGLFLGLLGYRMYKISLFVIGLFFGLALGSWIGESLDNVRLGLILGIVLGLAFGVATHFLIRFSLFLAGMGGGLVVASLILPETSVVPGSWEALAWSGAAALAGGLLTLLLYKILILFVTSLIGTYMIYVGTIGLFPPETAGWNWILYVVLLVIFVLVQIGAKKGHEDPVERERERRKH